MKWKRIINGIPQIPWKPRSNSFFCFIRPHLIWFQLSKPNLLLGSTFVQLSALHSLTIRSRYFFLALSSLSTPQTPHRQTMMLLHRSLSIFLFIPTEMSNEPQAALTHQPERTRRHRNTLSLSLPFSLSVIHAHTHTDTPEEVRGFRQQCVWPYEPM